MAKLFMWVSFSVMLTAFIITELYRGVWITVFVVALLLSSFVMMGLINWAYRQIMTEDTRTNELTIRFHDAEVRHIKAQTEYNKRFEL